MTSGNTQPDSAEPSPEAGRSIAEPKRPRSAPVGPDGQPLPTQGGSHGRGLILGVAAVLAIGIWLLWAAARATTEDPKSVKIGKDYIEVSRNAETLASRVEKDGPRLYPGLAGTEADFWVNRVNDQWFAFAARPGGAPRSCNAQWRADLGQFTDGCTPDVRYGPTGAGLPQYDIFEEEGRVGVRFTTPTP